MEKTNWDNALENLRHRLDLIQSRVHEDSTRFEELRRQAEYTKVQFMAHQLDTRRKFLARSRGAAHVAEPRKSLPLLGTSAVMSILTGIITKDGHAAMNVGVGSLNSSLQGLGETEWAVCLGKHLAVAPQDHITQGDIWVTWDSFQIALHELEERAKSGTPLGNLDNIISELKKGKKLLFII
ncbi:hypothetical protein ACFLWS_05860 [Chloroflexota bacterium]